MSATDEMRPLTILIAALGGEGGGVLMNWIVDAAQAAGLPVQATSVPGVAQRTGATSYYIEILPKPLGDSTVLSSSVEITMSFVTASNSGVPSR